MNKNLVLVGGGGHCRSVIDVAEGAGYTIIGILGKPEEVGRHVFGYEVIGTDKDLSKYIYLAKFIVTVGQVKNANLRIMLHNIIEAAGGELATIVSSTAKVSKYSLIGKGTVVMHQAVVNSGAIIGKGCIVNTCANIEHDVVIGEYCHISTGVMINGECKIGDRVFIGSQSVLINGVSVKDNTIIGAGSVVVNSIKISGTYLGCPAKLIKPN